MRCHLSCIPIVTRVRRCWRSSTLMCVCQSIWQIWDVARVRGHDENIHSHVLSYLLAEMGSQGILVFYQ